MNKFFKSKVFIFIFLFAIFCVVFVQTALSNQQYKSANAQATTTIQIKVVTLDGTPLKNAKVTVIENMTTADTNIDGYTPVIQVPYNDTPLCKLTVSLVLSTLSLLATVLKTWFCITALSTKIAQDKAL